LPQYPVKAATQVEVEELVDAASFAVPVPAAASVASVDVAAAEVASSAELARAATPVTSVDVASARSCCHFPEVVSAEFLRIGVFPAGLGRLFAFVFFLGT